ncbi:MAG: hypothetical protein AAB244_03310, partial [Nitrospirota bacterium]
IKSGPHHLDAIGFDMGSFENRLKEGRLKAETQRSFNLQSSTCPHVDIAFTPRLDTWRGEERIQMRIRDIRMTSDKRCT